MELSSVFGEKSESTETDSHSVDLMGGYYFFDQTETIEQALEHLSEWLVVSGITVELLQQKAADSRWCGGTSAARDIILH